MPNLTSVTVTSGVPTAGTGTVSTIDALMADGGQATLGLTTGTAVITDATGTLQQYLRGLIKLIAAGINITTVTAVTAITNALPAGTNLIGSVTVAPSTTDVAVTPTVTVSAYTAGNVLGGIMTFASLLAATSFNGVLHSITAKFKGTAVTGSLEVAIFKASPSNGTYSDKSAPTWDAADMANLLGVYTLTTPNSKLGTMTIYNLDSIGKAIVGASQSLYVVAIVDGTPTPASTSDFTLELAVLPG